MAGRSPWMFWVGVGLFVFGVLLITSLVQVFPQCSTTWGFIPNANCFNPLGLIGGVLNMILGIVSAAAGLILVLRTRGR